MHVGQALVAPGVEERQLRMVETEQMKQAGATEEQAQEAADQHRAEVRAGSERRLKHWFVVRKVAQQEKVRVSDNELDAALRALAARQNADLGQLRQWFKEEGRIDQLRADILEEKVRNHLVQMVEQRPEPSQRSGLSCARLDLRRSRDRR